MDEIIERAMDSSKWPSIELPENLEVLNDLADESFAEGNLPGMLSALLMYHQIVEAMCVHLLDSCHFIIQLSVYPASIKFSIAPNRMLGAYIKELQDSLTFDKKGIFLEKVTAFNIIRNEAIHKLRKTNTEQITQNLKELKPLFDEIYSLYDEIQDNFRSTFHSFKKDVFIDEYGCDESEFTE